MSLGRRIATHVDPLRRTPRRDRRDPLHRDRANSYDHALAETVNGYYKTELIRGPARSDPWRTVEDVEPATLGWVHWHSTTRVHGYLDDVQATEFEAAFYATHGSNQTLVAIP